MWLQIFRDVTLKAGLYLNQMKRFGQKDAEVWCWSGFWLDFLLWLFYLIVLFHPYFGLGLFISTFCCCCCCCAAPTSVWAACPSSQCAVANCGRQPVEVAGTSSRLFASLFGRLTQPWGPIRTNNSTTSHQATCLMTGRERGSTTDGHLETRIRVTLGWKHFFIYISLLQTWCIFYWCICICCSVFPLVVSDWSLMTSLVH